jgi:hypothetical protein
MRISFLSLDVQHELFFRKIIRGISIAVSAKPVTQFLRRMFRKTISMLGVSKELSAVGRKDEIG